MEIRIIISTFAPPEPAKPLNDAQMCGSFFYYAMNNRIPFQKPYANAHDLVCLLQSRGLIVADTVKAERYLEHIGYYRLSAYMYPLLQMPKEEHRYKPNSSFDQVMSVILLGLPRCFCQLGGNARFYLFGFFFVAGGLPGATT